MVLTTEHGWRFSTSAEIKIDGQKLDMDKMTKEQKLFLAGKLKEAVFNAAFQGQARFHMDHLTDIKKLFPQLETAESVHKE